MYDLLYSRIMIPNFTNHSSNFLFHRNMTGRQHVHVKMNSFHRREMFMVSIWEERFPPRNDLPTPENPSKQWGIDGGMRLLFKDQGISVKISWKNVLGKAQRSTSNLFDRLMSTFFVHLERVTPWTQFSFNPKHLRSVFCLHHCTEVANDLLNTKFNGLASVLLLLSHRAVFNSVGLVLLETLSLHFN